VRTHDIDLYKDIYKDITDLILNMCMIGV